jgi:tRNA-specific 2-thiouridylase
MKFGIFQDYALDRGFDALATGHYVRKRQNADRSFDLIQGMDGNKDQTYFLAMLQQKQIEHAIFPVGELSKPAVRALAKQHQLPNAEKKDSQGICFLGDMNINRFLEYYIDDKPGDIINADGKVLGQHQGLHRYTLGQRRWIGVPSNTDNEFYVVIGFNMERNQLIIGFDKPESPGLFGQEFEVYGLSFVNHPVTEPCKLLAKPRYRDASQQITYTPTGTDTATVVFDAPQRALAAGQIIAFYRGETLLGGGFYR